MKKNLLFIALFLFACAFTVQAKTALVIIAHGAPSAKWNAPVLDLEKKLNLNPIPGISYTRVALMEFSEPHINTVINDCEKQGIDTVFALPLFIAPSSHSEEDIPNILGLKYNPNTRKSLKEEGAKLVNTKIHIVLGPTLSYGDIIYQTVLQPIKKMSVNPSDEAVLILAHGDPEYIGFWNELLKGSEDYVKKNTSINYTDAKLVAMGVDLSKEITPLLQKAAAKKKTILVQGIYLSSNAYDMAKMSGMLENQSGLSKSHPSEKVLYSQSAMLPECSDAICQWIVRVTQGWLQNK